MCTNFGRPPKKKDKEEHFNNIQIDVARLLPADRGYYTFDGSLTTPPYSEGVMWYVLKHPVTVTAAEIEQFSKLYRGQGTANSAAVRPDYAGKQVGARKPALAPPVAT